MITAIEIENFKCFAARQRIETAPITLLYGPNSSGKSSVMYALLLFSQWLDTLTYSFGKIDLTGGDRDLGFSHTAPHNHIAGKPIKIKVEYFDSDSKQRKAVEISVKTDPNDLSTIYKRRSLGDYVSLESVSFEVEGIVESVGFDYTISREMRHELKLILDELRIIGAIRDVPPIQFSPIVPSEVERKNWFRGIAAWHWLAYANMDDLFEINQWLGPGCLDAGVEVVQQRMLDFNQLTERLNSEFCLDRNISQNDLLRVFMDVQVGSEPRVRIRPLQGKAFPDDKEPMLWPHEVGVGVSQLLPIVVACLNRNRSIFLIQEPESHVHPRLQARIADLFIYSAATNIEEVESKQFVIESHSEHIVHRIKRRIRETTKGSAPDGLEIAPDRVSINYLNQDSGATKIQQIHLDIHGEFIEPWPDDFFDLDFNERFA